jgi:Flp pilus assembly pilin Flp
MFGLGEAIHTLALRTMAWLHDTRAQTLAEYGLLITVIAVGIVLLAMLAFRDELAAAFASGTDCLDGAC